MYVSGVMFSNTLLFSSQPGDKLVELKRKISRDHRPKGVGISALDLPDTAATLKPEGNLNKTLLPGMP